jgi:putative flippase GtrA
MRYSLGSVAATVVSAVVFAIVYRLPDTGPRVASVTAFVSGAVVNFLAGRFWTWRARRAGHGRGWLGRDILGYAVIAVATAVAATMVTSAVDRYADGTSYQAVVVELSYFATYGVMFAVKFVLLDHVVFRRRSELDALAPRS